MSQRIHFLLLLTLIGCLAVGCGSGDSLSRLGTMSHADSVLIHVIPEDVFKARLNDQISKIHPDSIKAGHWLVRIDDPRDLEAMQVYLGDEYLFRRYRGSWARQQALLRQDLRSESIDQFRMTNSDLILLRNHPDGPWDAELLHVMYAALHVPERARYATINLGYLDPDHAADSILQYMETLDKASDVYRLTLDDLASATPNLAAIDLQAEALRMAAKEPDAKREIIIPLHCLWRMHSQADSTLKRRIEQVLVDHYMQHPDLGNLDYLHISMLVDGDPLPGYLPLLEQSLQDSHVRAEAVLGVAKIKGPAAKQVVLDYLADTIYAPHDPEGITYAWADSPFAALPVLVAGYEGSMGLRPLWLRVVWQLGGRQLADAFLSQLKDGRQRKTDREYFHLVYDPIGEDHPLMQQALALQAAGLIGDSLPWALLDSIQVAMREKEWADFDEALLEHYRLQTWMDDELEMPAKLDRFYHLVSLYFPLGAGHHLDGMVCVGGLRKNAEGQSRSRVGVVFRGRGYYAEAPNYDFESQLETARFLLHQILADIGVAERFIPFPYAPKGKRRFLFVKPELAEQAFKALEKLPIHPLNQGGINEVN